MNTIEPILDPIICREGDRVNHPADRGGQANFGITAQTLGGWRKLGRPATAAHQQHPWRSFSVGNWPPARVEYAFIATFIVATDNL